MRRVTNVRDLGLFEKDIAKKVFKNTIRYDVVLVSDGLGGGNRPFTVPTSLWVPPPDYYDVSEDLGKYVIHAGDAFNGMSYDKNGQNLLIHELTHVWQGEHGGHYLLSSIWAQALGDAYKYDSADLVPWGDYNSEQQAQIVEDWFAAGMKEGEVDGEYEDRRFYYIKKHIREEEVAGSKAPWEHHIRELPSATLHVDVQSPSFDSYLLPILESRFHANDYSGVGGRVEKLDKYFRRLEGTSARKLLARLEARRHGDKVAQYFHDHLAKPTRDRLTDILRKK